MLLDSESKLSLQIKFGEGVKNEFFNGSEMNPNFKLLHKIKIICISNIHCCENIYREDNLAEMLCQASE